MKHLPKMKYAIKFVMGDPYYIELPEE